MKGIIQRFLINAQTARMHEAVSDSVYVVGAKAAERAVGEIAAGEQPSGTLTDMVNNITKARKISLLHLSDNHGSLYGLNKMVALLGSGDDAFGINTGDITSYSSINNYAPVIKVMTDWNAACNNKPILLLKGNHDTWDISAFRMQEKLCTSTLLKPVNNGFVMWGDPNSNNGSWSDSIIGGYFYKDIVKNGVKLRLIALDEYQHSVGDPRTDSLYYYTKVYSQAQVDWLINLLRSTPSDYYIIMAHHQPLYEYHPTNVLNDFVHHGINGSNPDSSHTYTNRMFTYKAGNLDMAARIVDAYQHKRLLSLSGYPSGVDGVTININADFRNCVPAKFACHINGHVHGDYCEYHPYFPQQLCLTIGTDSPTISNWYDDLVRSSGNTNNHAINRVTIDADRDVVIVERIGADTLNTSLNWITQDGSARKWIEFKIPATMENTAQMVTKSELDEYCPIIEDTRSSAVAEITGVAPFDTLVDGQRILLYLKYGTAQNSTLQLTLSNGTTVTKNLMAQTSTGSTRVFSGLLKAGWFVECIYSGNEDFWLCNTVDTNTTYAAISQSDVDGGTSTTAKLITAKLLVANFAKKRTYVDNSADASVQLAVTTYNDLGTLSTWKPVTLPAAYNRGDEFVFRFECGDADLSPALPSGVVLADGFDFSEMAVGVVFQVSIMDGVAAYLTITPNS